MFAGNLVLAPADDFEAAVDASEGDSLASSDKLADEPRQSRDEGLATLFFDLAQYEDLASTPEDAEEFAQAQAVAPEIFEGGIAVSAGVSAVGPGLRRLLDPAPGGAARDGRQPALGHARLATPWAPRRSPTSAHTSARSSISSSAPRKRASDLEDFPEEGIAEAFESETGVALDDAAAAIGDASLWVRGDLPDGIEVAGEIETSDPETAAELIEALEAKAREEGDAKIGPPVGGSDVGFSALERTSTVFEIDGIGSGTDCVGGPTDGCALPEEIDPVHADLPFANIELDGDVIRYGFFRDEEAAAASDPDSAGDFSRHRGVRLRPGGARRRLRVHRRDRPRTDPRRVRRWARRRRTRLGGSPEDLAGPFLAGKLGVVAFGQRFEDDASISALRPQARRVTAGAGIDLIEIERVERALERRPALAERIFSSAEREFCARRARPGAPPRSALRRQGGGAQGTRAWAASACTRSRSRAAARGTHAPARPARPSAWRSERGVDLDVSLTHTRDHAAAVVVARPT